MLIRRTATTASFVLLLALCAFGQKESPKAPKEQAIEQLSSAEQLDLRAAEVNFYQAQQNMQQSPQYQQFQAAQTALQDLVNGIYKRRKVNATDVLLCDGPSGGPTCANVPKGKLELLPVPKEVKK